MRREPPGFWYAADPGVAERLAGVALSPLGWLYGMAGRLRIATTRPRRAALPVVCVGNFTAGGAGKTPVALALARLIGEAGLRPAFLTRGYGGRVRGPHVVDPGRDTAREVGDEPLLLARVAPVVVAANRVAGADLIAASDLADVIIMDDGLQNPSLHKDLAIAVVDATRGIGNGRVMPGGPLRMPLGAQTGRVDLVLLLDGGGGRDRRVADDLQARLGRLGWRGPIIAGRLVAEKETAGGLAGRAVIAYAGIGNPQKFFATLEALGARLVETVPLGDHQLPDAARARALIRRAGETGARLVTTEKDLARLAGETSEALLRLAEQSLALPVGLALADGDRGILAGLLGVRLARAKRPGESRPGVR
ncbi:MAG: tetraacyldisaccharide 4'-kinase [Hyphomicrobiaceae bacterium]